MDFSDTPIPLAQCPSLHFAGRLPVRPGRWRYRLPEVWSLLLTEYRSTAYLDGRRFVITPGTVIFVAPDVAKDYRHLEHGMHRVAHFAAPDGGPGDPRVPAAFHPGRWGDRLADRFATVVTAFPRSRERAEIALWDLLHLLAEAATAESGEPDAVDQLTRRIEQSLHTEIVVADLVAGSGYSHSRLLELFRDRHGETIVGYVRRRRMEQARQLLSTDMAISVVAAQVGIPDLQAFNKIVRQFHGCSPRALREKLVRSPLRSSARDRL